jgi:thiol-disulfide isomerase/thioredoxin
MRISRALTLIIALIAIIGVIYWLESQKSPIRSKEVSPPMLTAPKGSDRYPRAKEIVYPSGFVNTGPITLAQFIGKKVILIDFMTYSCINCQRTFPYLNAWWDRYKDHGLAIVGIHTPEFDFEKDINNVRAAAAKYGLKFPIVLDNDQGTWNAYGNLYWPHEYLIDIYGGIIHDQIGEGSYEETERAIQKTLKARNEALGLKNEVVPGGLVNPANAIEMDASRIKSEETYFGSARDSYLGSGIPGLSGIQTMPAPRNMKANMLYLTGQWDFRAEYAENKSAGAAITYIYNAKNVYLVANSPVGVKLKVLLDGKPLDTILVKEDRLYKIVEGRDYGEHTLEIVIERPGLRAYTFTFG